jgi:histidine kinase/DNA gyrase B/HSP90-like ATPase/phospho-acceptor domain-containing protein
MNGSEEKEEKTEVLYGIENAVSRGIQFMQNAKKSMDLFGDKNGPSIIIDFPHVYKDNYIEAKRRGVKIRFITEITKDNISYCKELMAIVDEFRHLEGFTGGIAISESEYMTTTVLREGQLLTQVFYSNAKEVVEQGRYIFDTFWKKAIPAEQKVKEIEEGIKPEVIETIRDPVEIQMIGFELVKSAMEEILIIFSTSSAFLRQAHAGAIELLEEAAERGIKIKILTPLHKSSKNEIIQKISQHKRIETRFIGESLQSKVSIMIVDRKFSLAVELKDDTRETSYEAIGLATYSNSKSTVISYASIFESLWIQSELYEQLKIHDKMQKEFIDVAAHELRTPMQPIIGLSEMLLSRKQLEENTITALTHNQINNKNKLQQDLLMLNTIVRNAKRLQRLTEDILDVTRIEGQSLKLNIARFNLNDLISTTVQDYKNEIEKTDSKLKFMYTLKKEDIILVEGDRNRLNQLFANLLNNAIKFTKKGTISVSIQKKDNHVIISIKDTGQGIDPQIYPRLFTKFATKSETGGTGLGLFISKSIVEAHGGRIWALTNNDGIGATFAFSLPLSR